MSAAAVAGSLSGVGAVQIICGIVLALVDIIGMGAYGFSVPGLFLGIILGIFYIITGSLTTAAGSAARHGTGNGRCLAVSSLVMSILSILNSFGIMIWSGISLAAVSVLSTYTCRNAGYATYLCYNMMWYGPSLLGATTAFLVIMFITSIVACVFSSKAMSTMRTTTTVTHVTHVAQPGVVYSSQQQYGGYPQAPQPYPAGQPAPYGQQYPAPYGQQKA